MREEKTVTGFRLYRMGHHALYEKGFSPRTEADLINEGLPVCPAVVPGCVERDLALAGVLPEDLAYGDNILRCQELERTHFFYTASFETEETKDDLFLCFGGIDTVSEIFVDGALLGKTENMLIPHEFSLRGLPPGRHELLVHLIPVSVYVMEKDLPAAGWALRYNLDSLYVRKAPYMYGWDILPRALSAGLWRPVTLSRRPSTRLSDAFLSVRELSDRQASVSVRVKIHTHEDDLRRFTLWVRGECEDSVFEEKAAAFGINNELNCRVEHPKIWQVKGRGKPYLYTVTVTLLRDGTAVDRVTFRTGLRTVSLERTSFAGPEGKFDLIVNGQKIFALGTNLVPTDIFPAVGDTLYARETALIDDIGCNMVRIWGGGVYRTDSFYDWCDEHGILIWHDFMMACAVYPQDDAFASLLREEAVSVVKRLRHHPAIALWSGDNECDDFCLAWGRKNRWTGTRAATMRDPNENRLTRRVLPAVVADHDGTRPYLPSSPYHDEEAVRGGGPLSEDHLWGPRDWFKGDFYIGKSFCHFASETGYHGCPSPASLRQFIRPEHLGGRGDRNVCTDADWLLHATCPEVSAGAPYAYRIPLMTRQVERLFGRDAANLSLEDYALQSQISQAEAMKFFVEHFRAGKGYRSGIIWWNLIDGFPEISDAVVDYYGRRKLAYFYIRRAQAPVCLLFDEPDDKGDLPLVAVNDTTGAVGLSFTVTDAMSGRILLSGRVAVDADGKSVAGRLPQEAARFLLISWEGDAAGANHFVSRIGEDLSFDDYCEFMKKAGYNADPEGF